MKYTSVGDASKSIKQLGRGCFLAKTDVKSAFRILPLHPADYSLLGMKWENLYYFDRTLPMGLSSSCCIFEAVSLALAWISSHHLRATSVLHILDDFLFIARPKTNADGTCRILFLCANTLMFLSPPRKQLGRVQSYSSLKGRKARSCPLA